jgi:hypothetical protein
VFEDKPKAKLNVIHNPPALIGEYYILKFELFLQPEEKLFSVPAKVVFDYESLPSVEDPIYVRNGDGSIVLLNSSEDLKANLTSVTLQKEEPVTIELLLFSGILCAINLDIRVRCLCSCVFMVSD